MPIGVLVDTLSILFGGLIGAFAGKWLTDDFRENLNMIFGCCCLGMGISTIVLMENMPAVALLVTPPHFRSAAGRSR
ncbi:MAG: DUF554 family protein [Lachnospiraceae bacterium]|nr:DUF554 family protein [Lachnospiraceae bacterium]